MVATIALACDRVLKRILKLSTYRLQIFLVEYELLRSLQLFEDQGICGKLNPISTGLFYLVVALGEGSTPSRKFDPDILKY